MPSVPSGIFIFDFFFLNTYVSAVQWTSLFCCAGGWGGAWGEVSLTKCALRHRSNDDVRNVSEIQKYKNSTSVYVRSS